MKSLKDIERLITKHKISPRSEMRRNILDEALKLHKDLKQQVASDAYTRRIGLKSRITQFAAAAIMILAIIFVVKNDSSQRPDTQTEGRVVTANLFGELKQIRQMAAASDVSGLVKVLSAAGPLESKLAAASSLAKIVNMPSLEMLTMHVSGDIVIDCQEGGLRLYSTKSEEWLDVANGQFTVHANSAFGTAHQVRLTHDVSGDFNRWTQRQAELEGVRDERAVLEETLSSRNDVESAAIVAIKERLTRVNTMIDFMEEAIYATIDESGRVLLNSALREAQASAELCNGKVRVESSHGHVVETDSVTLLMGLRPVRTEGPPLPTTDWRIWFNEVYSLVDGEVLRWVRPPFIPERQIYATQDLHYYETTNNNPPPPAYLFFRWNGKLYNWTLAMERCNLALVLHSMGLKRYEYDDGPEQLSLLKLGGDWIERNNTSIEDRLSALEKILQDELGRTIRFERHRVNRDVIIVRGQYKRIPLEGVDDPSHIYVYPDSWEHLNGPEPVDGGGRGSLAEMLQMVGSDFELPMVFETANLSDISVYYRTSESYGFAKANAKTREEELEIFESVLGNLSRQTSLQFEHGERETAVWFIREEK